MARRHTDRVAAVVLAAVLGLAACGGETDDTDGPPAAEAPEEGTAGPDAAGATDVDPQDDASAGDGDVASTDAGDADGRGADTGEASADPGANPPGVGQDGLPEDFPAEVPLPDGELLSGQLSDSGDVRVWALLYLVESAAEADAYLAALVDAGYVEMSAIELAADSVTTRHENDDHQVIVTTGTQGSSTSLAIAVGELR